MTDDQGNVITTTTSITGTDTLLTNAADIFQVGVKYTGPLLCPALSLYNNSLPATIVTHMPYADSVAPDQHAPQHSLIKEQHCPLIS